MSEIKVIGPEVPDADFAEAMLRLLEGVVDESGDEWDQPPMLAMIYQRARTPVGQGSFAIALEWLTVLSATGPLTEADRPQDIVVYLAERMLEESPEARAKLFPPQLMAVALVVEAWMLESRSEADSAEVMRAVAERRVHEAPDRVEVKWVQAADINGVRYSYSRTREGFTRALAGLEYGAGVGGEIPNALTYLVEVGSGRDVPLYDEWERQHPYGEDARG